MPYNLKLTTYNSRGFTLIEIIVTLSIVAVGYFTIINIFPFNLRINKTAQNLTTATYLAQAGIEQALSFSYDDLGSGVIEPKSRLSDDSDIFLYHFWRETNVQYVDENLADTIDDTGMKKVEVIVYWYDPMSFDEKSYTLSTLVSRK